MPLELLLPVVVLGIGGIVLLIHLFGFSQPCVLKDEATVANHWLRHFPGDEIISIVIDDTSRSALVDTGGGAGLIWSFGADTVARRLERSDIEETEAGFRVRFHDFTAPGHVIQLSDDHHTAWRDRLNRVVA
jgi:hypothetical protein